MKTREEFDAEWAEYQRRSLAWAEGGKKGPRPPRPVAPHTPGWAGSSVDMDVDELARRLDHDPEALETWLAERFPDPVRRQRVLLIAIDMLARRRDELVATVRHLERIALHAESLSFGALRAANNARVGLFRNARGEVAHAEADGSDWTPNDWMVAVVGEIGESANLLKKMRRGDFGAPSESAYAEAMSNVSDEFADVVIYMDLLAHRLGIDLGEAVREKFNAKSRQVGADVWL